MGELSKLGRYQLSRVLGRGAMGVVYEGLDPALDRRVAVKTILKSAGLDEETERAYSEHFVREAKAVARLNHPNIVQVYDFGEENEVAYLVMEFIQGRELRSFITSSERFMPGECVRIMSELLDALDFAHERGVIHRDVKPANVILDDQRRVKLADFGVARVQDSDRSAAGTMVGTPAFMSPEQIQGLKIDRRTDIFSAGVVLYQLLTGEPPFKGEGAWTVAKKIMQDEPPPPSSIVTNVSAAFDAVVERALAKNPAERFATAREFAAALRNALVSAPAAAPVAPSPDDATVAITEPRPAQKPSAERKRSFAIPAMLAAAVTGAAIGVYFYAGRTPAPVPVPDSVPAQQVEKPVPAKPEVTAADIEKIRKETEERVRREYADKSATEQAAAAKSATEKAVQEKMNAARAEKAALDKLAAEKAAAEKAIAAKAAAEQAAAEQAAAEKAAAEKAIAAKASADKAAAEKAAAEKVAAERVALEKAAAEKARLASAAGTIEQFKARHPYKVVEEEPPNGSMQRGEILYVNDKSCPQGQIRELTGGALNIGVDRKNRCISLSQ